VGGAGQNGANPLEWMTRNTGSWAIYILLLTLAITPLRRISGWNWLQKFRRMLGLFAFLRQPASDHVYLVRPFF
jgi:sulfoxide reductase heme-binding subunit YedZ